MNKRYLFLLLFGLLALVQLYVPAAMILNQEQVLATGKAYKFQLAPVDPSDPFRGKYITLQFKHNSFDLPDDTETWENGELIFVELAPNKAGYARIRQVSKERPAAPRDSFKTRVLYVAQEAEKSTVFIDFPFDRFYLEESKALPAEQAYTASLQDTTQLTYALVHIKDGDAVLKEVYIGQVPIREVVLAARRKP
jgi:uncharacterized membrane-anchored protein